tara:strand:- start:1048 stop:1668 length:621 start_codon:yes stop_codon:yes gene_type:complete
MMTETDENTNSESSIISYDDGALTNKQKCKYKKITLLFIPICLYFFIFYRNANNTPFLVFIISIITFWNFPFIVTINNSKPLYYEDLFVNTGAIPKLDIESKTVETFRNVYHYFIIFTNSIFTSILVEYWVFKTKNTTSIYEIIGITGGILQIFKVFNNYTGLFILKIIKMYIKNNIKVYNYDGDETNITIENLDKHNLVNNQITC